MSESPIFNPFDEDDRNKQRPPQYAAEMSPLDADSGSRSLPWLIVGVAVVGCGMFFAAALFIFQAEAQSIYDQYFPSPTATKTPTPLPTPTYTLTPSSTPTPTISPTRTPTPTATVPIVLLSPANGQVVFEDTFDSNNSGWTQYYGNNTAEVRGGHIVLWSEESGYVGAAFCADCPSFDKAFYFQAELLAETITSFPHGLLFCINRSLQTEYYAFQVDPQRREYDLLLNTDSGWTTLVEPQQSAVIKRFPASNTLAVRYYEARIEMYINGQFVHSFTAADEIACGDVGFIIQGGEIKLFADNVFAYPILDATRP